MAFPLSHAVLEKLTEESCASVLGSTSKYIHEQAGGWSGQIVTNMLDALTAMPAIQKDTYRFNVNCFTIQHDSASPTAKGTEFAQDAGRGMHSASGAFWNANTDGMWTYKFDGRGERGFDVVVTVLWMKMA